jgi:SAM-dependent methyltransferase
MTVPKTYDMEFYEPLRQPSFRTAQAVVPLVQEFIPIRSVCDVGCGDGGWLKVFLESGVEDVWGCDGGHISADMLQFPAERFRTHDLRGRFSMDRTFDLAMANEIGHYLPEERAASFVEDLTRLAPVVLFSSAIPRQGGGGARHLNEQWPSYWADLFAHFDFLTFDVLRPRLWDNSEVFRWVRQNQLLFCRRDAVPAKLAGWSSSGPLCIVHPEQFIGSWEDQDVIAALTALGAAVRKGLRKPKLVRRLSRKVLRNFRLPVERN